MNINFENVPHESPAEAFEHIRGRYVACGFWKGVRATLLILLLIAAGIGYAVYRASKEPGTGPVGVVPPQETTEAVTPPLGAPVVPPRIEGGPAKTSGAPPLPPTPGLPPRPGLPPGARP